MTPDEYQKVTALFDQLRELPELERAAALESVEDEGLRAYVAGMLDSDRTAPSAFLGRPALDVVARMMPAEAPELPTPGTVIGQYRIIRQIGSGGMAAVFEGEDLRLGRRVAVKILLRGSAGAQERIERFQREARAVSSLNHPNIVSIFDAGFEGAFSYIAMEYVEGRTLRQVIASGERPHVATILDWMGQAASALKAAHDAQVVHRDIKPENIMIRPDGFIKVLDFGLAKLVGPSSDPSLTRPGSIAGTIQYLAPEQISGGPVTQRSDLFSLGVVAYELATGVRPFDGPTDGLVYSAILTRTPVAPSVLRRELGKELDGWILRALERDPERRFQSAEEFRSVPASSFNSGAPASVRRGPRVKTWGLVVLAVPAVIFFLWLARPAPQPQVTNVTALTRPGQVGAWVTDGTRIYYEAGTGGMRRIYQVSVRGGDPVPMPWTGMVPMDVSPDRSELLLGKLSASDTHLALWVASVVGNPPRPLAGLSADYARWSPAGDAIVYCRGHELMVARRDGSGSRALPVPSGQITNPVWSRDGRKIRFSLIAGGLKEIWEVGTNGENLHRPFADLVGHWHENGNWSPDGRWFVFAINSAEGRRDLWAQEEGLFATQRRRLTSGPVSASAPWVSADGRRIFYLGELERGELVRYDQNTGAWAPHLGGLEATQVEYSRDGKWITFIGPPRRSVWRAAADGSQRLQLTEPDLVATNPRWSPDGSRIAFFGNSPGKPSRIFVVPATGGAVQVVTKGEGGPGGETDASWSTDGGRLVYGVQYADQQAAVRKPGLRVLDLATQRSLQLTASEGLWSPRWSPDGRYVAALGYPNLLWMYDMETGTKTQLTSISAGFPSWSADSRYVYFEDGATSTWYRIGVRSLRLEKLASLSGLSMASFTLGWVGLAADGSLISTREAGGTEVYALDWHDGR